MSVTSRSVSAAVERSHRSTLPVPTIVTSVIERRAVEGERLAERERPPVVGGFALQMSPDEPREVGRRLGGRVVDVARRLAAVAVGDRRRLRRELLIGLEVPRRRRGLARRPLREAVLERGRAARPAWSGRRRRSRTGCARRARPCTRRARRRRSGRLSKRSGSSGDAADAGDRSGTIDRRERADDRGHVRDAAPDVEVEELGPALELGEQRLDVRAVREREVLVG